MPQTIHSDQGRQFVSKALEEVYDKMGITRTTTPAYNPKSNPVERSHRDLKACLNALNHDNPDSDWEENLGAALLALRTSIHKATGVSPFYALFGQEARLPCDITLMDPEQNEGQADRTDAIKLERKLKTAYAFMRKKLKRSAETQAKNFQQKEPTPFQIGDYTWLFTPKIDPKKGSKFSQKWT